MELTKAGQGGKPETALGGCYLQAPPAEGSWGRVGCKWATQAAETPSRTRIKRGDAKACPGWRTPTQRSGVTELASRGRLVHATRAAGGCDRTGRAWGAEGDGEAWARGGDCRGDCYQAVADGRRSDPGSRRRGRDPPRLQEKGSGRQARKAQQMARSEGAIGRAETLVGAGEAGRGRAGHCRALQGMRARGRLQQLLPSAARHKPIIRARPRPFAGCRPAVGWLACSAVQAMRKVASSIWRLTRLGALLSRRRSGADLVRLRCGGSTLLVFGLAVGIADRVSRSVLLHAARCIRPAPLTYTPTCTPLRPSRTLAAAVVAPPPPSRVPTHCATRPARSARLVRAGGVPAGRRALSLAVEVTRRGENTVAQSPALQVWGSPSRCPSLRSSAWRLSCCCCCCCCASLSTSLRSMCVPGAVYIVCRPSVHGSSPQPAARKRGQAAASGRDASRCQLPCSSQLQLPAPRPLLHAAHGPARLQQQHDPNPAS